MSMSAPFRFLQLPGSPDGVILRMPLRSVADGRSGGAQPLMGTVNASIRLGDLIRGAVPSNLYPQVAMRLLDMSPAALPKNLLSRGQGSLSEGRYAWPVFTNTVYWKIVGGG